MTTLHLIGTGCAAGICIGTVILYTVKLVTGRRVILVPAIVAAALGVWATLTSGS